MSEIERTHGVASLAQMTNQRFQILGDEDEIGAAKADLAKDNGQLHCPPARGTKGLLC